MLLAVTAFFAACSDDDASWNTNADGTYYFDPITGAMAKGTTTIDGMTYYFDPATGVKR